MKTERPILKIVIIVWVIFSVLYVIYTQYQYLVNYVGQNAYQRGLTDAVAQVIQQAQTCKEFPITIGNQGVNLINTACNEQGDAKAVQPNTVKPVK